MISRPAILLSLAALAGAATVASLVSEHRLLAIAQGLLETRPAQPARVMPVFVRAEDGPEHLLEPSLSGAGAVTTHDGAYLTLAFPVGNVSHITIATSVAAPDDDPGVCIRGAKPDVRL
jgi:hypothetical protein